jgi:hypothetical protein
MSFEDCLDLGDDMLCLLQRFHVLLDLRISDAIRCLRCRPDLDLGVELIDFLGLLCKVSCMLRSMLRQLTRIWESIASLRS